MRQTRAARHLRCLYGNLPNRQTCPCAGCTAWRTAYDRIAACRATATRRSRQQATAQRRAERAVWVETAVVKGTD